MIVYLARDIPAFVMYCINGASRSSLLINCTDSMKYAVWKHIGIFLMLQSNSNNLCDLDVYIRNKFGFSIILFSKPSINLRG